MAQFDHNQTVNRELISSNVAVMAKLQQNTEYSYHLPTGGLILRIRSFLSQFSDLFSEFNKYIAPTFHHDRCERSAHMRLYTMHKREFLMVFLAFFACFGLGIFIGLAGPPITWSTEINAANLRPNTSTTQSDDFFASGPFAMKTPLMTTYAQQLWVIAVLSIDNTDGKIRLCVRDKRIQILQMRLSTKVFKLVWKLTESPKNTNHNLCYLDI